MKIMVNATSAASGTLTGIERFGLNITQRLYQLDSGITVVAAGPINGIPSAIISNLLRCSNRILNRKEYVFRAVWDQITFRYLVITHKPDVVFFPIQDGMLYPPAKQVVTVHDLHYLHFGKSIPECRDEIGSLRAKFYNSRMPLVLRDSAAVIAVSGSTRQELSDSFDIPLDKIHVVYNGYDETRFRTIEYLEPVLSRYGLRGRGYFLFVGSILPHKNLVRLLRAYALLESEDSLVFVGAGKDTGYVKEILTCASESGLSGDRFCYLEYVPDDDLPYLYNGALAFVLPSLHEGFGVPIIEAMACGTPVVTSNCSAMPEVAGGAALLVDPSNLESIADGMRKVMNSRQLCAELRRLGLIRAREFRWDVSAAKLYDILKAVAQS